HDGVLRGRGLHRVRRHGLQGTHRDLRAARSLRPDPGHDPRPPADLRDQEGRARGGDALPARFGRRAGAHRADDPARNQQGDVRRMSVLARFFTPPRPDVAVEIAARHVAALRLRPGTPPGVAAHAVEPLPDGLVVPSMTAANLADPGAVAAAVGPGLKEVGGARHAALVVPDSVARVSLVRFEQTPPERDLEAMLRWHVRKSVPFRIEDALLTWSPGAVPAGGGAEFVAVAAQ